METESSDDEPLRAAIPLAANARLREKATLRANEADRSPASSKGDASAKVPPSRDKTSASPSKGKLPLQSAEKANTPSLDSLFDDDGLDSQGSAKKKETSMFEADPGVFAAENVAFDTASPSARGATSAPTGNAQTQLFDPGPSQFTEDNEPLFDNGDADDAMDVEDALLSPRPSHADVEVQDVKPTLEVTPAQIPATTGARSSSPIVVDDSDPAPASEAGLAPPDLVVISATPGNSQVEKSQSSPPAESPGRKLSIPQPGSLPKTSTATTADASGTTQASSSEPAASSSNGVVAPGAESVKSPVTSPSSTTARPLGAGGVAQPEQKEQAAEKPLQKIPPWKRPRYEQPKRIKTIDTNVDTTRLKSLKNLSFKKNASGSTSAAASAVSGPSPTEPVSTGAPTAGNAVPNTRSWVPAPSIGLRRPGAAPYQSASTAHVLPGRPQGSAAANIHPSRRHLVSAPTVARGTANPYESGNAGLGRMPPGGGGRSPYDGNRSPYGLDGNRSPGAGQAANGNRSPAWPAVGSVSPIVPRGGASPLYGVQQGGIPPQAAYQPFQVPPQMPQPQAPMQAQTAPAVYEAQKDPRRRMRQAQTGAPVIRPICVAQVCLPDQRRLFRPLTIDLLAGGTKAPNDIYMLRKLPELGILPDGKGQEPPQFTALDSRCIDLVRHQGGTLSEWCLASPSANNTAEQLAIWTNIAQTLISRKKMYIASEELVTTWPNDTRKFVLLCAASRVDVKSIPSSTQPTDTQILVLVLSIPIHARSCPPLPNPIRPDFATGETVPRKPSILPAQPHNLADSYGLSSDSLSKLKGSIQMLPPMKNDLFRDTVANVMKVNLRPPQGPEAATNILLFNSHMPQLVRSGWVAKGMEDDSRFYMAGPDLTLPADQWLLHPVWETGGVVTFSPTLILLEPAKFKMALDFIVNVKNWVAYVHPTTVVWCQESWGDKRRCLNPSVAYETFASSLFTEDKVRQLAGDLPADSGGLAVTYAPPSMPRKRDCDNWLSWLRKVFNCSNYEELLPLCREGHEAQQAQLFPNSVDGDVMKLSTVEETGLRDLIAMRERPDLLPYRRYLYVGPLSRSPADLIKAVSLWPVITADALQVQHVQVDNFAAVLSGAI